MPHWRLVLNISSVSGKVSFRTKQTSMKSTSIIHLCSSHSCTNHLRFNGPFPPIRRPAAPSHVPAAPPLQPPHLCAHGWPRHVALAPRWTSAASDGHWGVEHVAGTRRERRIQLPPSKISRYPGHPWTWFRYSYFDAISQGLMDKWILAVFLLKTHQDEHMDSQAVFSTQLKLMSQIGSYHLSRGANRSVKPPPRLWILVYKQTLRCP